jgi:hypothetical protein
VDSRGQLSKFRKRNALLPFIANSKHLLKVKMSGCPLVEDPAQKIYVSLQFFSFCHVNVLSLKLSHRDHAVRAVAMTRAIARDHFEELWCVARTYARLSGPI